MSEQLQSGETLLHRQKYCWIEPKSTIYRFVRKERGSIICEGFRAPQKAQQAPGLSPKVDSAVELGHHYCRACSGMAIDQYECICMHSEGKTFVRCPGEGQPISQYFEGKTSGTNWWTRVHFLWIPFTTVWGIQKKGLSRKEKVSATISSVSCQQ